MQTGNRQLVEAFFKAIARGDLPDHLATPDMTFWSVNSGESDREQFHGGVEMLASIFDSTLIYLVSSLTSEDDRVVAEVRSQGTLGIGEAFHNTHVFLFRIRSGCIAAAREYMNQFVLRQKIVPPMQAAMDAQGGRGGREYPEA